MIYRRGRITLKGICGHEQSNRDSGKGSWGNGWKDVDIMGDCCGEVGTEFRIRDRHVRVVNKK